MKKLLPILALLLAAALLFAACNDKPVNGETTDMTTTAPESLVDETSSPEETSAPDGETTVEPTTEGTSTSVGESTTSEEPTAPALPAGKAEILAAYTKVVNKVKTDMPQYTNNDWQTLSNVDMSGFTYGLVESIAGGFLETKEQSNPGTQTKGTHAKWFAMPTNSLKEGCVLTDTSKITSATATKSGDAYIIKITLAQEKDPVRDMENPRSGSGWHGKMFDVIDITEVTEYAKKIPGIDSSKAYCTFVGTATLKYNPVTNECISLDHVIDVRMFLGIGGGGAKCIADYHFYDFKW